MRNLALTVLLSACVQPTPDSGARYTLTHYLAEIRLEDRTMQHVRIDTDSEEWGRVTGAAVVLEDHGATALVRAASIRADILVPWADIDTEATE